MDASKNAVVRKVASEADIFSKVPEFLAAFNNILKNGFFKEMKFETRAADNGKVSFCGISAEGFVPCKEKYKVEGCSPLVDPKSIVLQCHKMAEQNKVKSISTKVESTDWLLWDDEETCVIESKGQETRISLIILFIT